MTRFSVAFKYNLATTSPDRDPFASFLVVVVTAQVIKTETRDARVPQTLHPKRLFT